MATVTIQTGRPVRSAIIGCYELIQKALKEWPIKPHDIPEPMNLFQTMDYNLEKGTFVLVDGRSKPGDYIDFVAQMDALCALSACPALGRAVKVQVYQE